MWLIGAKNAKGLVAKQGCHALLRSGFVWGPLGVAESFLRSILLETEPKMHSPNVSQSPKKIDSF